MNNLLLNDFDTLNAQFEKASPQTILRWAAETYAEHLAFVTSFQPSGLVMLHMLREIMPNIMVLTLDTGLLFPETLSLMERWEHEFGLNLVRVRPGQTVKQQAEIYGVSLWERDPDLCCQLRKTIPLADTLPDYQAWITGVRRDQSERRRSTPLVSWDSKYNNVKLAPLATWTQDMVWTYIHAHELPYNPLHDQAYPSIGCQPCTQAVAPGQDVRAGRWVGRSKTECGIHLPQ